MTSSTRIKLFLLAAFTLFTLLTAFSAFADGHGTKRERSHQRDYAASYPIPAAYKEHCGSCHMAYGAYLLPEASWRALLDGSADHFGTELSLDAETKQQIADYLFTNAADRSDEKIGRKIMRHSQGYASERISTLPYIQRKHRKVNPALFQQSSVGGLQNCIACHPGAEQGDFDDDRVSIPR